MVQSVEELVNQVTEEDVENVESDAEEFGARHMPTLRMQLQPGICPFPVLGFWGTMTMPNAGTMAYRRDLPSTTRI